MPFYIVRQTEVFRDWLDRLGDIRVQVRIAARLRQFEQGNPGDWKPLGGNLSEMRIDIGPGYRLYFTRRLNTIIIMLAGGTKSGQKRDIKRAREMLENLESDNEET